MSGGDNEISVQRVLQQFEHDVIEINRQNIREIAGEIGKNEILKMGEAISICRAKYLKSVLDMVHSEEDSFSISMAKDVKSRRLLYEETMLSFAALRHALERGYVVVTN